MSATEPERPLKLNAEVLDLTNRIEQLNNEAILSPVSNTCTSPCLGLGHGNEVSRKETTQAGAVAGEITARKVYVPLKELLRMPF